MAVVAKKIVTSIDELRTLYPNALEYLISKGGDSISVNGFYINLNCSKTGCQLIYDQYDIKVFDNVKKQS